MPGKSFASLTPWVALGKGSVHEFRAGAKK